MAAKHFLRISHVAVSANARHIQESVFLFQRTRLHNEIEPNQRLPESTFESHGGPGRSGGRPLIRGFSGKHFHCTIEEACLGVLEKAHADHFELITLFYGSELSKPEANRIADSIRSAYPEQSLEVQEGGQPHYSFIIAIE